MWIPRLKLWFHVKSISNLILPKIFWNVQTAKAITFIFISLALVSNRSMMGIDHMLKISILSFGLFYESCFKLVKVQLWFVKNWLHLKSQALWWLDLVDANIQDWHYHLIITIFITSLCNIKKKKLQIYKNCVFKCVTRGFFYKHPLTHFFKRRLCFCHSYLKNACFYNCLSN